MCAPRFAQLFAAAALVAVLLCPCLSAQQRLEVGWMEVTDALGGRIVSTVLDDGTVLKGRVLGTSADEMRFVVRETSNRDLYAKGERAIPRRLLSAFSYTERRGRWRALGTAIGGGAGGAAAGFVCVLYRCGEDYQNSDQGAVIAVGVAAAGATIGYFLGREADTRSVTVTVRKDSD